MQIRRLTISTDSRALVDIDFSIRTSLALVGESGSGKSLTLKALLDMLPTGMTRQLDLEAPYELKRGDTVTFVPQNPFTALSPLTRIKEQFFVPQARIEELFAMVGLEPALMQRFAPELSGGQLQRVVIAMALSSEPKLLLLDEPTTALDPKTRNVIIALLKRLQRELGFSMLFVTHDMHSAESLCDDICVIKSGRVVEAGKMERVIGQPESEYTRMLIEANFFHRDFRV